MKRAVLGWVVLLAACGDEEPRRSFTPDLSATATANSVAATILVLDAGDRAVGDVLAQCRIAGNPPTVGAVSATSAADGRARLDGLDTRHVYEVRIAAPPNDERLGGWTLENWSPADLTVRLPTIGEIGGQVVDAYGRPVPEAEVVAQWADALTPEVEIVDPAAGFVDGEGRFRLRGMRIGRAVEVIVLGPFHTELGRSMVRIGEQNAVVAVRLGAVLRIRVEGSRGDVDLQAICGDRRSAWRRTVRGATRFVGLAEGDRCTVWTSALDDERYGLLEDVPADGQEHAVRLVPGEAIEGEVVWPEGIKRRAVQVVAERGPLAAWAHPNKHGRFRFPGLPKGVWTLKATVDGDRSLTAEVDAATGGEVTLTLHRQ